MAPALPPESSLGDDQRSEYPQQEVGTAVCFTIRKYDPPPHCCLLKQACFRTLGEAATRVKHPNVFMIFLEYNFTREYITRHVLTVVRDLTAPAQNMHRWRRSYPRHTRCTLHRTDGHPILVLECSSESTFNSRSAHYIARSGPVSIRFRSGSDVVPVPTTGTITTTHGRSEPSPESAVTTTYRWTHSMLGGRNNVQWTEGHSFKALTPIL